MGSSTTSLLAVVLLALLSLTNAYILDKSCNGKSDVHEAIETAFKWASAAEEELQSDSGDTNVDALAQVLFSPSKYGEVAKNLANVALMGKEYSHGTESHLKEDPIIYCNLDHIGTVMEEDVKVNEKGEPDKNGQKTKKKFTYFEQDQGKEFFLMGKNDIEGCRDQEARVHGFTLQATDGSNFRPFIQLCPWYIEKAQKAKYPTVSKINWFGKARNKVTEQVTGTTPIDGFALLEQKVLHELTHTPLGGKAEDLAYQWSNCVKLGGDKGAHNADSISYFGLAVDLIKNRKIIPDKDGNLKPADDKKGGDSKKRHVKPRQWVG